MNITSENFEELYPQIKDLINQSEFISFDLEMTGIMSNGREGRNSKYDTPQARYAKMVPVASKYAIVQIGLCFFQKDTVNLGKYVAYPYTFYVFPESGNDIVLSASSIKFLKENNMDFNTWISKGIKFVDNYQDEYMKKKYDIQSTDNVEAALNISPPPVQKQIVLTTQSDIEFMDKQTTGLNIMLNSETETQFEFDFCNAYLKKAIYQYMDKNHPTISLTKNENGRLVAMKMDNAEKEKFDMETKLKNIKEYEENLGFKKVFKDLISSKKPIVGHNCFFDILFCFRWLDRPLCPDLGDFKSILNICFPIIYDTKYIANCGLIGEKYSNTVLSTLYEDFVLPKNEISNDDSNKMESECNVNNNEILIPCSFGVGHDQYNSSKQFHDAGYDAYCTGAIFIAECEKVKLIGSSITEADNKLFMMQSLYHMDLSPSNNKHGWVKFTGLIILISNFEASTVTGDIVKVFTTAEYDEGVLDLVRIDATSSFITIENCEESIDEIKMKLIIPTGWKMESYDEHLQEIEDKKLKLLKEAEEAKRLKEEIILEEITGTKRSRNDDEITPEVQPMELPVL
jgi:poly(A)-specific ribonuclease